MRGPPIHVICDCGEERDLSYGETWTCERCGKRWNTQQIPLEEYQGLTRELRRLRFATIGLAVLVVAVLLPLVFFVNEALLFLVPILLAMGAILLGPLWKKRVRRLVAERPRWELHPE
jgi:hypothetical protein